VPKSPVALWIPRENSAHTWFFYELANDWAMRYTPYYFTSTKTDEQRQRAITKSRTEYRVMVSRLSKLCIQKRKERSLTGFVREATRLLSTNSTLEITGLNVEWDTMIQNYTDMYVGDVLPVLDISLSMTENGESALCKAIGIACFLLEKTTLEKRILTIDQTPSWIVIDSALSFVSMVELIRQVVSQYGQTTKQVCRTMDLLAQSFAHANTFASSVLDDTTNISLVILSDMSFGNGVDYKHDCEEIRTQRGRTSSYLRSPLGVVDSIPPDFPIDESIRSCFGLKQIQYLNRRIPHITYWNVGETFVCLPCEYDRLGATVISGASPNCARGILPDWYYDDSNNLCHMVANTPFDSMCSLLSRHSYLRT
jgi:hypothetical protein